MKLSSSIELVLQRFLAALIWCNVGRTLVMRGLPEWLALETRFYGEADKGTL